MRLRVRVRKQTHRLELEEEKPTLGDLRKKLSTSFLPSLGYSMEETFIISLNGRDPLTEDPDMLESCGIIPGDLIVVLVSDSQSPTAPTLPHSSLLEGNQNMSAAPDGPGQSSSTTGVDQNPQTENVGAGTQSTIKVGVSVSDTNPALEMPTDDDDIKAVRSPWEPMLCSEAVDGKIPHSLETLYCTAGCICANDALIVVIHLLMLETGYLQQGADAKIMCMPEAWRSGGVYKLHYTHPLCNENSVTLTCVPLGKFIVVNATLKVNSEVKNGMRLQLSTDSYISFDKQDNVASVYKDLQRLSRQFKDQLVYPLLATTRQVLNLPDTFGLIVLPLELKLRIFRLLDVRSILSLSASCRDLWTDSKDPFLWRFLYKRDFKDPIPGSAVMDWKSLYQKRYKQKLDILRMRQRIPLPETAYPLPYHINPYYPTDPYPYPPGIIGGEYDQRPILPIFRDPGTERNFGYPNLFHPHFDHVRPLVENNPLSSRNGVRPTRSRGHDIHRAFI
ncbi:F-box only protein 7 [Bombina bombina]|uniref:F-box only protein 7 n=1 Tax=Bombina bombina TaxID=8345 RepID=UPI00235B2180|nr:F-box only protein 7 [Bombina bombina]XP_053574940.1 F-box only protein 7 [Bombina bombina]XP_053574941.1 F-box only protein 7 [Bombina bombina]XP_053574942.1 F-box only protein 7 [Bombina bombina]